MMLTEGQKAYWAGIVDGEGNISACVSFARFPGRIYPQIKIQLGISNTDQRLIDAACHELGMSKVTGRRKTRRVNSRECYNAVARGSKAVALAADLLPYLRIKKTRAYLVQLWQPGHRGSTPLSKSERITRHTLMSVMRWLNRRGARESKAGVTA